MNRRAILAGAAILPAASIPVLAATESDPILAAIEEHRLAWAAIGPLCDQQAELERTIPQAKRQDIVETDDPRWIAFSRQLVTATGAQRFLTALSNCPHLPKQRYAAPFFNFSLRTQLGDVAT